MRIGKNLLGSAGQPPGIQRCLRQFAGLGDPAVYRHLFCATLEFALLPHAVRHPQAEGLNFKSKSRSCKWAAREVRDFAPRPNWQHACLIGEISVSLSWTLQRVRRCRYSLYLITSPSVDLFGFRRISCMRRMAWGNWDCVGHLCSWKVAYSCFGKWRLVTLTALVVVRCAHTRRPWRGNCGRWR